MNIQTRKLSIVHPVCYRQAWYNQAYVSIKTSLLRKIYNKSKFCHEIFPFSELSKQFFDIISNDTFCALNGLKFDCDENNFANEFFSDRYPVMNLILS